jgi:hypothetical protein
MASHGGQHYSVKVPTAITIEGELTGVEEEDVSVTHDMGC